MRRKNIFEDYEARTSLIFFFFLFLNTVLEPGMVAYTCDPRIWDVGTGRSKIHGYSRLYSKPETSLGYTHDTVEEKVTLKMCWRKAIVKAVTL